MVPSFSLTTVKCGTKITAPFLDTQGFLKFHGGNEYLLLSCSASFSFSCNSKKKAFSGTNFLQLSADVVFILMIDSAISSWIYMWFRPGLSEYHMTRSIPGMSKRPNQSLSKPIMGALKERILHPWTWNCENVNLELFNSPCPLAFISGKGISENEGRSQRWIEIGFDFDDIDLDSWSSHTWRWKALNFLFMCTNKFCLSSLSLFLSLSLVLSFIMPVGTEFPTTCY